MSEHTIVVGGGAIGLSIAWERARRGDRVTLLERNDGVGKATSWSAAGILPPADPRTATDPIDRLRGLSHQLFPQWTEELHSVSGIDPGFRRCGGLYLADTPGERASMIGMTQYWQELDIRCERIDQQELTSREPAVNLSPDRSIDAWWVPDECQIRSPDYVRALQAACVSRNAEIITDAAVRDVRWDNDSASVQFHERWLQADRVVICGGAWTGRIATALKLQTSVVPVRGQILLLKTDEPLLRSIVNVGHRYVLCRDDGHTLVGSCEEEVGFELGTTSAMLAELHRFAIDLVPQLEQAVSVDAWSGLRPMTFDGFPMIGRLPDSENVFVAAGHFRSGIHLSPGTAMTLADVMEGRTPQVDLDAFRIGKQQHTQANHVTANE